MQRPDGVFPVEGAGMKNFGKEVRKSFGKWRLDTILGAALAAGVLGTGAAQANAAQIRVGVGFGVSIAAPVAYVPPCPGPGYAWVAGYWNPYHVWVPGYWNFRGPRPIAPVVRGRFGYHDAHRGF